MSEHSSAPSRSSALKRLVRLIVDLPRLLLIGILLTYRWAISPLYGQVCRYFPSCSAYALEAVTLHGAVRGSYLAVRRLLRCHPWSAGGIDHVPAHPHLDFERISSAETPRIVMLNHPERYLEDRHDHALHRAA
ncbi:membrane protein insertion efficiency factor YidD [Psychromicrobium xiongbiense]|uniref:membrane protein insertion efficiency factor YidD n=1 Tax=Psychromicrobium xiongbiense TaxID=3051184 RepID=UPI0025566707|nr:membrane protein insertion efficiency factor YidD [Psychromicrobium sp. YIM S02556]